MPLTVEEFGYGVLAPAVTAAVVLLLWQRESTRLAAALALSSGFIVGYLLLPWAPMEPKLVWHWLPHIAAAVLIAAPAIAGRFFIALPIGLALSFGIAYLLVPDWPRIEPQRNTYWSVVALGTFGLWLALLPLSSRVPSRAFGVLLLLVAFSAAIVLAQSGNMKFAQLAGLVLAATAGCVAVCLALGSNIDGIVVPYVALLTGLMFVGYVYSHSEVPTLSYLLIPLSPVALWLSVIPPIKGLGSKTRFVAQTILLLIPLAISLTMALLADPPWQDDGY